VNRTFRAALALGSILSLAVSLGIANLWFVVGSREGHWYYQYVELFDVRALTIVLQASAVVVILLALPEPVVRRREWWIVVAWLAAGLALQGWLRSLTSPTFEQIFASDGANSFYSVTRQYGAAAVLRDFERLRSFMPLHAQSNMPGKLLLVYTLELISTRPAVLAWLVVALSNLGGVVLYVFVRELFGDRRVALFSLVLYLFVPAKLYFFPLLNTVTPVVVLACAWLTLRWVTTGRATYAALFGVVLYGLVLYEPLALTTGLLLAALVLRALSRGDISWRRLLRQCGIGLLTFAGTYVLVLIAFQFDLFGALRQIGADAAGFNARHDRPYAMWIGQNLIDFLFGVGVCQALVFWAVLGESLRGPEAWSARLTQPIAIVCLSLAGILLATDAIGVNRGEVVRLWIFLACVFQIPAAYACARLQSRTALAIVVVATLLQDALGTLMIGFVMP